jgi:hypothetical protein
LLIAKKMIQSIKSELLFCLDRRWRRWRQRQWCEWSLWVSTAVGTSHNPTGNLTPLVSQSRQFLLLRTGNLYSQKHTAQHRYLYTTNRAISVHNSSMNTTKTPIGSRAAWRQLAANSIKMRPAGPTDTVATKLATRPRQIYLSTITDQKQQVRYYSDRRPARLYQTSVPPACSLLTKPPPRLIHSPARSPHRLPAVRQPAASWRSLLRNSLTRPLASSTTSIPAAASTPACSLRSYPTFGWPFSGPPDSQPRRRRTSSSDKC